MSNDFDDLDLESLDGQAEAFRRARQAIDDIGPVEGASDDGTVRVWVTVTGNIVDVELTEATRRMGRDELSSLIVAIARRASNNAALKAAEVMARLEEHRNRLLEDLEGADPFAAAALRKTTASTTPVRLPEPPIDLGF